MTHAQYLDEPAEVIDWTLQIAALESRLEAKEAQRGSG